MARADRPGRHYRLVCSACGDRFADDGLVLKCRVDHKPALLRTDYGPAGFRPRPGEDGVFRYRDWLPVTRSLPGAGRTVVFRNHALARALRLKDLWIAFNGYSPKRGIHLETTTFKELEAYVALGRVPHDPPILVIPSVGNTAAAFATVFGRAGVRCLLVIPERGLERLRLPARLASCVRLVVIANADYNDAIRLADRIAGFPGFQAVGGLWNVARRDALATVLLAAVEAMGGLPDYYFQAVGSGVGAIAVHEAAQRLVGQAGYGTAFPRLMMCQNASFAPIRAHWRGTANGSLSDAARQRAIASVGAPELVNRRPPFLVRGGVRDVLVESDGDVLVAGTEAMRNAQALFLRHEGVDIEPAAAVAVACLAQAVERDRVPPTTRVLLNITGAGRGRLAADRTLIQAMPHLLVDPGQVASPRLADHIGRLFP